LSHPWDIDDKDTSIAHVANLGAATANNSVFENMGIDKIESDQKANQLGIKYTTEQSAETKLLRLLNDDTAPHFLYQDILAWALEAKRNKYSFCPQHLERSSQVKYLEK
jgi:GT2 family glycosyltransferase